MCSLISSGEQTKKYLQSSDKNKKLFGDKHKRNIHGRNLWHVVMDSSHSHLLSVGAVRGKRQPSWRNALHSPLSCWNTKPLLTLSVKASALQTVKKTPLLSLELLNSLLNAFLKARILHVYTSMSDYCKQNNSFRLWITLQESNKWTTIIPIF